MAVSAALPSNPWAPDAPFAEAALAEAEIGELQLFADSSNYVFLARLHHPAHGEGFGVYKPARGETPLWDFPPGTIHRREVAAYRCARFLGWDLVPPTVLRDGPHGPGSMQLFITHDPARHYFTVRGAAALRAALVRIAAFDLVANNADRKGGHVLLDPGERPWCIDNGLCFHAEEKLRTVVWDFAGERLGEAECADLDRLARALTTSGAAPAAAGDLGSGSAPPGGDPDIAALHALLAPAEVAALGARAEMLAADPVLPAMYPWRCVPWPLV